MLGELDMNPDHLIHRFAYMKNDIPIAGCAHQAGTARFGTDPSSTVLDTNSKAHESTTCTSWTGACSRASAP